MQHLVLRPALYAQFFNQANQALSSNAASKAITWQAFPKKVSLPTALPPSRSACGLVLLTEHHQLTDWFCLA